VFKAAAVHDMDVPALLASSAISIGLFHTAGKGTRLAPLPGEWVFELCTFELCS
jgi:hypothetical protein